MTVRAVTFDFWGTLVGDLRPHRRDAHRRERIAHLLTQHHLAADEPAIADAYADGWRFFNLAWTETHRTLTARETVVHVCGQLGHDAPPESLLVGLTDLFETSTLEIDPPEPLPGIERCLETLAAAGLPLGIISDTGFTPGRLLRELLDRYGLLRFFTGFAFSDETGVAKPDPLAFETAAGALGVRPDALLHVGDIQRTDIAGAQAVGAVAVLYVGHSAKDRETTTAEHIVSDWADFPALVTRHR